jgi:hypothetical protein
MLVNENTRRNLEQEIAGFRAHAAAGERAMQARPQFARCHYGGTRSAAPPLMWQAVLACGHASAKLWPRSRSLPGIGNA